MLILFFTYISDLFPIKILASYFVDNDKLILKHVWKGEKPRIAGIILKKNRRLTLSKFKISYKATVISTMYIGERIGT